MKSALLLLFGACFAAFAIAQSQSKGFDITGNKNCQQTQCKKESALSGSGATECCVYFLSGCCMPSENDFLHNMLIVAIACGIVLLVIIIVCCVLCFCCWWYCCGMLCSGGSGRRLQPAGPQYQQLESPVNNIQVVSSSNVTTHPY